MLFVILLASMGEVRRNKIDIIGSDGYFTPSTPEKVKRIGGFLRDLTLLRKIGIEEPYLDMDEEMIEDRKRIHEEGLFSD
jgi:hypothetical protein